MKYKIIERIVQKENADTMYTHTILLDENNEKSHWWIFETNFWKTKVAHWQTTYQKGDYRVSIPMKLILNEQDPEKSIEQIKRLEILK